MQCNFVISVGVDSFVCDHFLSTQVQDRVQQPALRPGAGAFGRIFPLWAALLN